MPSLMETCLEPLKIDMKKIQVKDVVSSWWWWCMWDNFLQWSWLHCWNSSSSSFSWWMAVGFTCKRLYYVCVVNQMKVEIIIIVESITVPSKMFLKKFLHYLVCASSLVQHVGDTYDWWNMCSSLYLCCPWTQKRSHWKGGKSSWCLSLQCS